MNPKNVSQEDLALFAMQLLTPEESTGVLTHLEHNEASREELGRIQGELALYALTSDLHSPPAMARERLMRRAAKEKKLIPAPPQPAVAPTSGVDAVEEPMLVPRGGRVLAMQEPARRSAGPVAWLGWAVAAGLGVAAGLTFHQKQVLQDQYNRQTARLAQSTAADGKAEQVMQTLSNPAAMEVALHLSADANGAQPPQPEGHAAYVADTGSLIFVGTHLAPLQTYKTYELWVIPEDGRDPIPAGTFKPDERGFASVVLPDIPKGVPAKAFGVTVEDDGGSKQGPTKPIILAGM